MLIFAILYRTVTDVELSSGIESFTSFGFEANGTFSIEIDPISNDTKSFYYSIANSTEFPESVRLTSNSTFYCANLSYLPNITFVISGNGTVSANGTVEKKGVYTPLIFSCTSQVLSVTLIQSFTNPDSKLDFRWNGILDMEISFLGFIFVLCITWSINCILHFKFHGIYGLIAVAFTLSLASHLLRFFEMRSLETTDNADVLTITRIVFHFFAESSIFIILLLASKGWCIIAPAIPIYEAAKTFLYSVIYMILYTTLDEADLGSYAIILVMLSLISLGLFVREAMISIKDCKVRVLAHLFAISTKGILAISTPMYSKYRMLVWLQRSLIFLVFMIAGEICASIFVDPSFWVEELIRDSIELAALIMIACTYWRKGKDEDDFSEENFDESNPIEVSKSQLGDGLIQSPKWLKEGVEWNEDMKIPRPPIIVAEKNVGAVAVNGSPI